MEAMQKEMNSPMDDAFEKLKQQGPPQWFIEAMSPSRLVLYGLNLMRPSQERSGKGES